MPALPRRPFLGIRVHPQPGGLRITEVVEGATAATSGIRVGDVIEGVNEQPVSEAAQLTQLLRGAEDATLTVRRGAKAQRLRVAQVPFPVETHPAADVALAELRVSVGLESVRWRTIVTTPHARTSWAVVYLGGIQVDSLERVGALSPLDHVLAGLARSCKTVRVERGVGDSEGPGPAEIDFDTEHRAYRSVLDTLRREGHSVALLGHSIGGMHAPRLPADARVVFGTSAARWSTCLAQSTARQLRLRDPGADTSAAEARARRFDTDALRRRPRAFHDQLDALDLEGAWRACAEPALVLHGEYDWVVSREESDAIADQAPDATCEGVLRTDHAFGRHASLEASLRDYGRGAPSPSVAERIERFLAEL